MRDQGRFLEASGRFDWLQEEGHIEDHEMYRVFNNGIGMAVIVAAEDAEKLRKL